MKIKEMIKKLNLLIQKLEKNAEIYQKCAKMREKASSIEKFCKIQSKLSEMLSKIEDYELLAKDSFFNFIKKAQNYHILFDEYDNAEIEKFYKILSDLIYHYADSKRIACFLRIRLSDAIESFDAKENAILQDRFAEIFDLLMKALALEKENEIYDMMILDA